MTGKFIFIACVFFLAGYNLVWAQQYQPGPQVVSFYSEIDDSEQPYALYLPKNFDVSKKYPLVISLHGAGSNHRLNLKRVFGKTNEPGETDVEASRYFQPWKDVDYIVASPWARSTIGYQAIAERDVMDVLADVKRRFPIDEDRVYLTGLSMGGGGTLWIGLTRPDLWAALVPVCPAPPEGTIDLAPNALNLPVYIHQGGADPVVKPEGVRAWVDRLKALDTSVEYTEYPGVLHDSWVNAYKDAQVFDWFGKFKRNLYPDRVRYVTSRYKYNKAYWVTLDAITPGVLSSIDARYTSNNKIEVTTQNLDAFTLRLAGHPQYVKGKPVELTIDGNRLSQPAADSVSFVRGGKSWKVGRHVPAVTAKRKGLEGPASEAVTGRHVYVYGTLDNPSREEMTARRQQAIRAANWTIDMGWYMSRVTVYPRIISDREVRPSDLEGNLVLFGTRETNALIQKYADRLPVHLNRETGGEYGLAYTFPIDGHYVVVSSGLPWYTPARQVNPFTGDPALAGLMSLQDFLLFKGTPDQPVVAGRFGPFWNLSEGDAEKMNLSGAVTLSQPIIVP